MNKTLLALAAGAALSLSAGTAQAGGLMSHDDGLSLKDAPPPVSDCCSTNWKGIYGAIGFGAGAVVHELDGGGFNFNGIGGEGIFGAFQLGYDTVVGNGIVVGGFIEGEISGIESEVSFGGGSASLENTFNWGAGVRFGRPLNCCTLWYATVGYTRATYELDGNVPDHDFEYNGIFFGGGAETHLKGNLFLKGEYRYTHYLDEQVLNFGVDNAPSTHTGRLSIVYKLNREAPAPEPFK